MPTKHIQHLCQYRLLVVYICCYWISTETCHIYTLPISKNAPVTQKYISLMLLHAAILYSVTYSNMVTTDLKVVILIISTVGFTSVTRSRATREANPPPPPSLPPPLPPFLHRAATRAGPLDTTRGASKEGGGGAPPSPLSRRVRAGVRGSFFVLGSGQPPPTAVGRHSCRSDRAPSSAAAWCVAGGPRGVLTSGGVGGAWTLDPAGERLQEAGSGGSRKRTWRRRCGGCARRPFGGSGTTGR
jgi:hypothetical protein